MTQTEPNPTDPCIEDPEDALLTVTGNLAFLQETDLIRLKGLQPEALAVAHELAIAQPLAVQGEHVRRRRHGIEAQKLLNPRR